MSTTSLKLPEDLKERAAQAAQQLGMSPHAFMVSAIDHATAIAEHRAQFVAQAAIAREQLLQTGNGYEAVEVYAYLRARLSGSKAARPKAKAKAWRG